MGKQGQDQLSANTVVPNGLASKAGTRLRVSITQAVVLSKTKCDRVLPGSWMLLSGTENW